MPYAYRKSERIRKNTEFVATMKGKRLSIDGLSLFYRKNDGANFRVGISVGKKLETRSKGTVSGGGYGAASRRSLAVTLPAMIWSLWPGRVSETSAFDQILKAVSRALQRSAIIDQRAEGNRQ